jgi:hypothetical protein
VNFVLCQINFVNIVRDLLSKFFRIVYSLHESVPSRIRIIGISVAYSKGDIVVFVSD